MSDRILSVTQTIKYTKQLLDSSSLLSNLMVQGEVSNLTKHKSGHFYFTLKDSGSKIDCVMFFSYASRVKFELKNGDKVIAKCSLSIYEASGKMQLYINGLQPIGLGDLHYQFEVLKQKLNDEGLFDSSFKKQLPRYPFRIGVVSGKESAALNDILSTIQRRWPVAEVIINTSLVQGVGASEDIIEKLEYLERLNLDVIILARGGGSFEDLFSFNDEKLIRFIFKMKTPIVSGVGHEIDYTLTDYVVDLRAPTPTGAAELTTPNIIELNINIQNIKKNIYQKIHNFHLTKEKELEKIKSISMIMKPHVYLNDKHLKLINITNSINEYKTIINSLSSSLIAHRTKLYESIKYNQRINTQKINDLSVRINQDIFNYIKYKKNNYVQIIGLIDAYSPLKTIKRGYSITSSNSRIVKSIRDVAVNDIIITKVSDGDILSRVVENKEEE